jgi:hypothetical protein
MLYQQQMGEDFVNFAAMHYRRSGCIVEDGEGRGVPVYLEILNIVCIHLVILQGFQQVYILLPNRTPG